MLTQLERQKTETLQFVEMWPPARLAYRPKADSWSAGEVLDHLVRTERNILRLAQEGLQAPHAIGVRDRLGFELVRRVFRSERRVKVPASASAVFPDPSVNLATIIEEWKVVRIELARMLQEVRPDQMNGGVFRHPVSGWMTLPQVLTFFSVHMQHHEFQLKRLKAASEDLQ